MGGFTMSEQTNTTIAEYIAQFDGETRAVLEKTYEVIRAAVPDATEKISYHMPCFWQGRPLIYFGAAKHHLGIYPTSSGMAAFVDRLSAYKTSKGAVQFPYNKPIPYDLIAEMARFKAAETIS
jgi:uncharacterized protein YdhG (YjbR/CyaY superfamily)